MRNIPNQKQHWWVGFEVDSSSWPNRLEVSSRARLVTTRRRVTSSTRQIASSFSHPHHIAETMSKTHKVTEYQERVYALLQQIPEGRITTYAAMSKALNSSPRAIGGALRNNPFAPDIPCHRCIASTGVSPSEDFNALQRELRSRADDL